MWRRHILLAALALALVVATIGGVAYALHTRTQVQADGKSYPGLSGPVAVACPGPPYGTIGEGPLHGRPYQADQGRPTIRPRNTCTPSFTQQDVRDYLAAHVDSSLRSGTGVTGQPTVTRVVFVTIRDLARVSSNSAWSSFGASLVANYPLAMLICSVGLSGTFIFSSGLGPPSHESAAFMTFDAHNGNQLAWGLGAPLG